MALEPKTTRWTGALAALVVVIAVTACGGGGGDGGSSNTGLQAIQLRTISNRADLITDGDALMELTLPAGASEVQVAVNGRDVSSAFARRPDGRFTGLVTGLASGANTVTANANGAAAAQL